MSKQIKENCQKMILTLSSKLQELKIFIRAKKGQPILQKFVMQIINDFKFFQDQFKLISQHHSLLQNKSYQQEMRISSYEKQLLNKNAQKKIYEQMMRSKYQKLTKEHMFLEFAGKGSIKQVMGHHRTKSELIKKGLNELERDVAATNKRVSIKVRQLQEQIQNQEQRYLTFQNSTLSKNIISSQDVSKTNTQNYLEQSPYKTLSKKDRISKIQLQLNNDDIREFKTKKKQLASRQNEEVKQVSDQNEVKSSQTVIINKKKKEELAELIAKQTKIIVSREKYFSTDI